MKFKLLLPLLFFTTHLLHAQDKVPAKEKEPCNCDILNTKQKKFFASEQQADSILKVYIDKLWQYSRIKKINDPFIVREAFCESPSSELCEPDLPNGRTGNVRLILYGEYFLKRLNSQKKETTLVDKHILLHELGHHVLGHHKNSKSIAELQVPYLQQTANPKLWNKYGADNPMAQELEADIFAVWALSKMEPGFSVAQLVKQFNQEMMKSLDTKMLVAKHSDHPLFKDRIETMNRYEAEMRKARDKPVARKYFADIASTAYLDLWPQSYVYDLAIIAGADLAGKADFKLGSEKVDAFLYPVEKLSNYHIGLSASRFRWDRPWQTGVDLQWSQHKYGTKIPTNDGERLVETFKFNYVTLCPKITWNSIGLGKQKSLRSLRFGLVASAGLNLRVPVGKLSYTNYISTATAPELLFSVGPKITVGAAILKKSFLPRGFKLLFSYDPQWIRLKADAGTSAVSHNLECTLQYSILRW